MIDEIKFSDRGERPSEFEIRLLLQSQSESPWLCVAKRLIQDLGMEAGVVALVGVLDEVGGEKLHVATRRHFFESLWRAERDELIVSLAGRPDWNFSDIGRLFGVSDERARKIAGGKIKHQRTTGPRSRGRHAANE